MNSVSVFIDEAFDSMGPQVKSGDRLIPKGGGPDTRIVAKHDDKSGNLMMLLMFFLVVLSIWPTVCLVTISRNLHVIFWVGLDVQTTNFLIPAILLLLLILVPIVQATRSSIKCLRWTLFIAFTLSAITIIFAGIDVLRDSAAVVYEIEVECGQGPLSSAVQNEYDRLYKFHEDCRKRTDSQDVLIQQCMGFAQLLGDQHSLMIRYIEAMEADFQCQGFCKKKPRALFSGSGESSAERCAEQILEEVRDVKVFVGIPTIVIGILVGLLGLVVTGYRNL
eukprot:TRINITY_DN64974_c0_g1_i1.p1 TRINITY_DN64974_c0_g1~~TRINITY_DN64974_c0_g1_i1.p1  ORF type:complete len:278 (-),score=30.76 TRINITY_DN64974_c0_g1_i1:123-956(-)